MISPSQRPLPDNTQHSQHKHPCPQWDSNPRSQQLKTYTLDRAATGTGNLYYIIIIGIQPLGRSGQRPEFSQEKGRALVRCILGKFLGVVCHCFPRFSDIPTFHHQVPPRPPRRERSQRRKWELWARMLSGNFAEMTTSTPFRDLLNAASLRHGTDGFTSPPKEGVLRIFSPLKIQRLRPGLNPQTWVLKASTLPLDHQSCCRIYSILMNCT